MTELRERAFTILPDPIDPRDHQYSRRFGSMRICPRAKIGYRGVCGPVVDQGRTGSCVGQACASLMYSLNTSEHTRFSARFIWMVAKEIDSWIPSVMFDGAGTLVRDAFKAMNQYGVCRDTTWPFDQPLPNAADEELIRKEAMKFRIGEYWALDSNLTRRRHLHQIGPFVMGIPVYANWDEIGDDGRVPMPDGMELGGHAILIVGYDDEERAFHFQNSWGEDWGDAGFGRLPYDYAEHLTWSAWGTDVLP